MYAEKEDAGVEAIPVLGADEVDVAEIDWWEKDRPGYLGVQDDGVGVEPASQKGISIPVQSLMEESTQTAQDEGYLHDPTRPLSLRLGHLFQQQHLQIRELIKLRVPIQHGMPGNVRWVPPSVSMLDVRLNCPLKDWIIIIMQKGRNLPHSRTAFIGISQLIIRT